MGRYIEGVFSLSWLSRAVFLSVLSSGVAFAQHSKEEFFKPSYQKQSSFDEMDDTNTEPVKVKAPPSYTKYRRPWSAMCAAMAIDGRSERFFVVVKENAVKDAQCLACKNFFTTLVNSCQPKKESALKKSPSKSKEIEAEVPCEGEGCSVAVEPSPSAAPTARVSREPNISVLDATSEGFGLLAEDQGNIAEHYQVVRRLADKLSDRSIFTPGELDYYSTLSEYMLAPFAEFVKGQSPKLAAGDKAKNLSPEDVKKAADALFAR